MEVVRGVLFVVRWIPLCMYAKPVCHVFSTLLYGWGTNARDIIYISLSVALRRGGLKGLNLICGDCFRFFTRRGEGVYG